MIGQLFKHQKRHQDCPISIV